MLVGTPVVEVSVLEADVEISELDTVLDDETLLTVELRLLDDEEDDTLLVETVELLTVDVVGSDVGYEDVDEDVVEWLVETLELDDV